jgi:hypothetical protein
MTRAGHDAIGKLLVVFDDNFIELVKYCKRVIDKRDPDPQADDVETIRDALEFPYSGKTLYEKKRKALAALTRLSAPVDVQAKAEAVVDAFDADYAPLNVDQKIELSRLIVEQFSRKG